MYNEHGLQFGTSDLKFQKSLAATDAFYFMLYGPSKGLQLVSIG